jgi:hypothetical protein
MEALELYAREASDAAQRLSPQIAGLKSMLDDVNVVISTDLRSKLEEA